MPSLDRSLRPAHWPAGISVCAAGAAIAWATLWPLPDTQDSASVARSAAIPSPIETEPESTPVTNVDWTRTIRWNSPAPSSSDAPPMRPEPRPLAQEYSRFALIGTIVEQDNAFALLQDELGKTDLQPVGGVLQLEPSGVRIAEIYSDHVVLSHNNREMRIELTAQTIEPTTVDETANLEVVDEPVEMDEISDFNSELDWLNGTDPTADEGIR